MSNDGASSDRVRIMLRPLGSPLPLGFFAFGIGVALMSAQELKWLGPENAHAIALVGLLCCLPLELGAAGVAFIARDAAAATILGLFASSWAVLGTNALLHGAATLPAVGVFDWTLGLACVLIALAALAVKPLFAALLLLAATRFAFMGIHQVWPGAHFAPTVGGIVGLVLAAAAFYGGEALLVEDTRHHTVLPVFRRNGARSAMEGDLPAQISELEQEAGVRQQL